MFEFSFSLSSFLPDRALWSRRITPTVITKQQQQQQQQQQQLQQLQKKMK